ncbi:MAG: O-antigen ligase family protein, partial [Myxococcota bacterium]
GRARFWALGLAVCGFLSVLLFPLARMASVALAVAAFFVVMLAVENRRRAFTAGVVGAVVLGAAAMAHAPLRARFLAADTSEGSGERGALLRAGLEAVSQHPLLGTGLGRFRPSHFVGEKAPSLVLEHTGKAHNQFVTIAAEGGVVALLLFVWVLAWLARRMDSRDPLGIAGLGALVLFGLLSLTHDPLFHASFSAGLTLVLGMAVARGSGAH